VQMKNIRSFKIIGLVLFALLLAAGCAKDGEKPQANLPPDTHISTFQVSYYPATGYNYTTNIYWSAKDPDSYVESYRWRIIGDQGDSVFDGTTNLSLWQETENSDVTLHLDFPNIDKAYAFEIAAVDDRGDIDATPATAIIAKQRVAGYNFPPNTEIANGPADGGVTASGVHFIVQGFDVDGIMDTLEYKLDTAATWTKYPSDLSSGIATVDITGLPLGVNTLLFRAHDNSGAVDPTPASVSFVVSDTVKPYLIVNSGALPGAFYFLPQGGTTTDLATTWNGDATFYFSTTLYRYAVDDTTAFTDWDTLTGATLTGLTAGAHTFYLQAKDLGDNIATIETEVGIGALIGDRGILLVNGIDWVTYVAEMQPMYAAHAAWGTRPVQDFWDLFSGQRANYPPVLHDTLTRKGVGPISGDTLGHYGTMVMLLNNFNGDLATFDGMRPLIVSYLKAGGNIVMGARFGESFIGTSGDLYDYTGIDFNQVGINIHPGGLVATAAGLINQPTTASHTFTDLPAIPTAANTTTLFTLANANYATSVGGLIVEPETGGKFAFIAGRCYRFNNTAMAANYDYILEHYMGE
jgi:hypothetical protein